MMRRLIEEHLKTLDVKAPRDFIGKHRRTEGGAGDGPLLNRQ